MVSRTPLVALVGRPNVGKSTLYNRIVPDGDAVVHDMPGVTRDRREGDALWNGVAFRVMDTGGLVPRTKDVMESAILMQGDAAVQEADLILFIVDARDGVTSLDREIADTLRSRVGKVLLVANKVEGEAQEVDALEANALGLGEPAMVSAQHSRGVGDMLDQLVEMLPRKTEEVDPEEAVRLTFIGKPNVGKSSLANRLLGEDRFIVHDEAGTTRDAVDVTFRYDGTKFVLVDTAGLRRRSHVETGVEFYSTVRTKRSLRSADVALLVLDVSQDISAQDARIAGSISVVGKSMIILLNKWDLISKTTGTAEAYERMVRDKFPLLKGVPILLVSAETGQRVHRIPEVARELWRKRHMKVPTNHLNNLLKEATAKLHPPLRAGAKPLKLYYMTQVGQEPPAFTIFVNDPRSSTAPYRRYLVNFFKEALDLEDTPMRLELRSRR